jgi:septum site-determining protein MinD
MKKQNIALRKIIISIVSGKGGVGKTTVACHLAGALALLGRKVLLVDGDVGLKNVDLYLGMEEFIVGDICDLISGKTRPEQTIIPHPKLEKLFILPAALSSDKEEIDGEKFSEIIKELANDYDYLLIDTPHGIGASFRNALHPAHRVIAVTTPEKAAIIKTDKIIGVAEDAGIDHKNITLLINRVEETLIREGIQLSSDSILETLNLSLLGEIPFDYEIYEANEKGIPVFLQSQTESGEIFLKIARITDGEEEAPHRIKSSSFFGRILGG